MLQADRDNPFVVAVGQMLGVNHSTVARAVATRPIEALEDRPRPGQEPGTIAEAKACLVSPARRTPKEPGYPSELRTTRRLARHARGFGQTPWPFT